MGMDPAVVAAQQQVQAAWVQAWAAIAQAGLSVGAIVAAIWISKRDRDADAEVRNADRLAEARDMAMETSTHFRAWGVHLSSRKELVELGTPGAITLAQLVHGDRELFQPPAELRALRGQLRRYGDAAPAIQNAFIAAERFRKLHPTAMKVALDAALSRVEEKDLKDILGAARECVDAIGAAIEAVDGLLQLPDQRAK